MGPKERVSGVMRDPELEEDCPVARQKASGIWVSKMGKGVDIEHTLDGLQGDFPGNVVKIMKRKCQDGRRALE